MELVCIEPFNRYLSCYCGALVSPMSKKRLTDNTQVGTNRLLIIACSKRKIAINADKMVEAKELYDGVVYRSINKWIRDNPDNKLKILILSANYGLIRWDEYVHPYNMRMNKNIAKQVKLQVSQALSLHSSTTISDIYVELGQDYINCLPDLSCYYPKASISYGSGRIGHRLHNLIAWLNKDAEFKRG